MDKEVVVHIHKGIWLSYKNECIWVSSNEVDELEPIIQSEVSQKEKDKYHILTHNIWNLERWYQRSYVQGSKEDTDVKNRLLDSVGGEGGMIWEDSIET